MIKILENFNEPEKTTEGLITQTDKFFGENSPLRELDNFAGGRQYEERPQQKEMAVKVAEVFEKGEDLCVEAPTGVGKTFAYLVPAIHSAVNTGLPVVVSTHTISLQEQIVNKDLPVIHSLLDVNFDFAIAKGRTNYLCLRRLKAAIEQGDQYLPSDDMVPEIVKLRDWSKTTVDGSFHSLDFSPDPKVWEAVCCEAGNCRMNKCQYCESCFYAKARRRLLKSQIIVANHALFFSDLAMKIAKEDDNVGILPRYAAVVLDEAHLVEDTAATHLGLRITDYGLSRILNRLYNREKNRGLLLAEECSELRTQVLKAQETANRFFDGLRNWLQKEDDNPMRYEEPGQVVDNLSPLLYELQNGLTKLSSEESDDDREQELISLSDRVGAFADSARAVLDMTLDEHVYWIELFGLRQKGVCLNAVPVEVSELLRDSLFDRKFSVIMTSATLTVNNRMDYYKQRIGTEKAADLTVSSPFDFQNQVELFLAKSLPEPNAADFTDKAAEKVKFFLAKTQGKAFVLFTSYSMMRKMAEELRDFLHEKGLRLYVQGEGLPRTKMLDNFKKEKDSVIFGTASFWTGVDVPGEALSNVIIVRLPFAVPDHPLVAARQEMLEKKGGNSFYDYSLPEAVLKFRQGFGRLIRSCEDTGIVAVLDKRIVTKRYGRIFLDSIPRCRIETV